MAHFAKLDANNTVISVHVVNNDVLDPNNEEKSGIVFLENLHKHPFWKQTSYNANFRKHFAGVGYTYDETRDAFIPAKPFPSWLFDEETLSWKAPVAMPNDGEPYFWDESITNWTKPFI